MVDSPSPARPKTLAGQRTNERRLVENAREQEHLAQGYSADAVVDDAQAELASIGIEGRSANIPVVECFAFYDVGHIEERREWDGPICGQHNVGQVAVAATNRYTHAVRIGEVHYRIQI